MLITQLDFNFYHQETHTQRRIQASLKSKEQNSKEGEWLAPSSVSAELLKIYFGVDAGWWQVVDYKDSKSAIHFLKRKESRMINWDTVLTLYEVEQMPLQLGQGGFGVQGAEPKHHFNWTVAGFVGVN